MDKKTTDRIAWATLFVIGLLIVGTLLLFGWGFVELIRWITSK